MDMNLNSLPVFRRPNPLMLLGCVVVLGLLQTNVCDGQRRLDEPPIDYRTTDADNPVSDLADKVNSGEIRLEYEPGFGYLRSILEELEIPISSQALVFSKTSLQAGRIEPKNPRAFYFNDDVYVGWIRGSSLMEVATADPKLGAVFYSIQMQPRGASIRREHHRCLVCHEKTTDSGKVPLHTITSVMTRDDGQVNLLLAEFETDHTSPFEERWGGWYVTGHSELMKHMGNAFLEGDALVPMQPAFFDRLDHAFDTRHWPAATSDIAALMVLEHQVEMHNRMTNANYAVRRSEYLSDAGKRDNEAHHQQINQAAKSIVEYLLFSGEAKLPSPVTTSSPFADEFAQRGPFDSQGRSLRQFDLQTRLFKYPCSYLVYSEQFQQLEPELLKRVKGQLRAILEGDNQDAAFEHLTAADREAILNILVETKVL